jgi:hypothetical protein
LEFHILEKNQFTLSSTRTSTENYAARLNRLALAFVS